MPRHCLRSLLLVVPLLLAGCELALPGRGADSSPPQDVTANAITGGEIEVTALNEVPPVAATPPAASDGSAPPPQAAGPDAVVAAVADADPAPQPTDPAPSADPVAAVPEVPKGAAQLACEKKGRRWIRVGQTAVSTCVKLTDQGDKRCTRKSQCEGECLARSGTCSPVEPLLGCNEVLQDNGARVTLCVE
jgi:hypothetical protein